MRSVIFPPRICSNSDWGFSSSNRLCSW